MPLRLQGDAPRPGEPDRRYYMIDVQVEKRRVRISSGTRDRAAAERKEQQVIDAVRADPDITKTELLVMLRGQRRGHTLAARKRGGWTFKQACDACLNNQDKWLGRKGWAGLASYETYKSNCNSLQRYIDPERPVAAVTQAVLDDTVAAMLRQTPNHRALTETTVNRLMETLRSVLLFAKYKGEIEGDLPVHDKFDEDNAREFVFTREEEEELLSEVLTWDGLEDGPAGGHPRRRDAKDYHDLFVFLLDVGCRLNAGLSVRWRDIQPIPGSPDSLCVRFWGRAGQKGSRDRSTPLTARARALIERRRASAPKNSRGPFDGLRERRAQAIFQYGKARCSFRDEKDAVIHAFRHTCATRLLELTGDIKLVQEWLGHTNLQTTSSIYAKVMTATKVRGAAALDAFSAPTRDVTDRPSFQDRNDSETGGRFTVTH